MSVNNFNNKMRARVLTARFKDLGFTSFNAFLEVLKMDGSITIVEGSNVWNGLSCTSQLFSKIDTIIEIIKDGEPPLEYTIKDEVFKCDKVNVYINKKGARITSYTKTAGSSKFTSLDVETLKTLCDNHREPNKQLYNKAIKDFNK